MLQGSARVRRLVTLFVASIAMLATLAGCAVKHPVANVVNGKIMFQKSCGSCHTLSHANTTGTTGPNLDDAFRQDRYDGMKSTSIQGLVDYWIRYPNSQGVMPSMLLKGQDAEDVAAYVAAVAARPGKDTGALAQAGGVQGTSAAAGKEVFTGVGGCGSCHTLAAAGTSGTAGPNLDQDLRANCATAKSKQIRGATLQKCIETAITNPYAYIPAGYQAGVMPNNFKQSLKPNEIQALVNFLSTAAK
jgi:mono/diheme cytochrome c family protein